VFEAYYRCRMAEIVGEPLQTVDGLGEPQVVAVLAGRALVVPRALLEYYAVAGNHWINTNHQRLISIEELEWEDTRLVFMVENQAVALWAVLQEDLSEPDPVVWEGMNGDVVEWHPTKYRVSQFLMCMWRFVMTGEQEEPV
jgi:hypothetical protein